MCRRAGAGLGGAPKPRRGSPGWRRGGAESGGPRGEVGRGLERRVRLRGRQRARGPGHEAREGVRSGRGRRRCRIGGGSLTKRVTGRSGKRGDGGSLRMGAGELCRAAREARGTGGAPRERASPGDPRSGTGVALGPRLGGREVSAEPWGEGSGPSQERAGGES